MDIKEARRLTGLTQQALADAAGCAQGDIVDIERGRNRNPSHKLVTNIVRAFQQSGLVGLTADELFPVDESKRRVSA